MEKNKPWKNQSNNVFWGLGLPPPSPRLLVFFFQCFLCSPMIFYFSNVFLVFSMEPSPKSLQILLFFVLEAFLFFQVFFIFRLRRSVGGGAGAWEASKQHAMCSQCGGVQTKCIVELHRTDSGSTSPDTDIMNMVPVTPPELLGSPPRTPESQ